MIQTVLGLVLLASPFLLINKFEEKKLGFCHILSFVIVLQLFIAVITQAFQIFTYPIILAINTIIFFAVIAKTDFRKILQGLRPNLRKVDWVLILVLIIGFIHLFSVHYNYSGEITTATTPYQEVENMQYPYPYFSDEWYAVASIQDSINSHSLPLRNPLMSYDSPFLNLELPFHSFLSEVFLLLRINPLIYYTILTIFINLLILVLIYLFLMQSSVGRFPAAIASLSALYITNGANLPGIWDLLPLNLGIISMLLGFIFITANAKKMMLFMALITLLFYPPLFVFYTLGVFSFVGASKILSYREKILTILYYFLFVILSGIMVSVFYFLAKGQLSNFFHYIFFSKIFYPALTKNAIPQYLIWNIIPIPILILSALGIFSVIKKKIWLVSILFLGIIYWILYSFVTFRFIIEYERVVVFTAILIIILAGFGLSCLIKALKRTNFFQKNNIMNYIQVGALILFLVFSFNYTKRDNWKELKLVFKTGKIILPAAPANNYLHPDDLRLFKTIKNQRFLSLPWKGTVIGVATDNYPMCTKPGTISINQELFFDFINSDCNRKYEIANSYHINYIYSPRFNCPNFKFIDKSSEELYLYKFISSKY